MLTYPLSSGVPTGYNYATKPDTYGQWFDGSNMNIRQFSDLFTTSNLTQAPALTTLYSGAGLTVNSKFLGATWHNWPNTKTTGIRTNVKGTLLDKMSFSIKTARTHDWFPNSDGSVQWQYLEAANDTMTWVNADNFVDYWTAQGADVLFTLGFTPDWASAAAAPAGGSIYGGKSANPPDNMADWSDFVSRVATRFNGRVKYYEIWNEPDNSLRWFNGTVANYAQMLRLANQAIKAVDATAKIIAPGSAGVGSANRTWLTNMLAASVGAAGTGKDWVDIVSFHQYYSGVTNFNTFQTDLVSYKAVLSAAGLGSAELWCDELGVNTTHSSYNGVPLGPETSRLRFLLRMIYIMAVNSVTRILIYSMDSTTLSLPYFSGDISNLRSNIETHVNYLINGQVTLVNQLADGRLAVVAAGQNYLI